MFSMKTVKIWSCCDPTQNSSLTSCTVLIVCQEQLLLLCVQLSSEKKFILTKHKWFAHFFLAFLRSFSFWPSLFELNLVKMKYCALPRPSSCLIMQKGHLKLEVFAKSIEKLKLNCSKKQKKSAIIFIDLCKILSSCQIIMPLLPTNQPLFSHPTY
jgi:hypothetical protein